MALIHGAVTLRGPDGRRGSSCVAAASATLCAAAPGSLIMTTASLGHFRVADGTWESQVSFLIKVDVISCVIAHQGSIYNGVARRNLWVLECAASLVLIEYNSGSRGRFQY